MIGVLMVAPRIYADFHNADGKGRLRLNCIGTLEDLSRHNIELHDGLRLTLYADDLNGQGLLDELVAEGIVAFSQEEQCWVAAIDWQAVRHASQQGYPPVAGADSALAPRPAAK